MDTYHFSTILTVTVAIYLVSLLLNKGGVLSTLVHRRLWNILLLITFLTMGTLGLVMAFLIEQNIVWDSYKTILWVHVEFGIVMALIAIFHIFWHTRYFTVLFKK